MTIDCGGSGSGILIENSQSKYFTIKNCTITNWGNTGYDSEIELSGASN